MLKKLTLFVLPLAFFAFACGGGSSSHDSTAQSGDASTTSHSAGPDGIYGTADDNQSVGVADDPSVVGDTGDSSTDANPPASDSVPTTVNPDTVANDNTGAANSSGGSDLFGAVNPFTFLGGLDSSSISTQVDPELGSALLTDADLPGGFSSFGDFSFTAPSEYGDMSITARMFASGLTDNDFGAMVISAAMSLPPEAMGSLDQMTGLSDADLQEIENASSTYGVDFSELSLLDADGLGEAGFGMHMTMDFGELFSTFGASTGDVGFSGLSMDMYGFVVGDRMLMVMVMSPSGDSPGVNARHLADIMNSRA